MFIRRQQVVKVTRLIVKSTTSTSTWGQYWFYIFKEHEQSVGCIYRWFTKNYRSLFKRFQIKSKFCEMCTRTVPSRFEVFCERRFLVCVDKSVVSFDHEPLFGLVLFWDGRVNSYRVQGLDVELCLSSMFYKLYFLLLSRPLSSKERVWLKEVARVSYCCPEDSYFYHKRLPFSRWRGDLVPFGF